MRKSLLFVLALLFSLSCSGIKFSPGHLMKDNNRVPVNAHGGGFLFHEGTYYWFGEHKIAGEAGNTAQVGVHCYSSIDLKRWTDRGIVMKVEPEGSGSLIEKGCIIERPKVLYNDSTGKFVMWFHLEPKGMGYAAAMSGVAVADSVTGPYVFLKGERPQGMMARDMTLFLDDDGKAYHIFASEDNRTLRIAELSPDFLGHSGRSARFFEDRYMEAPAMFKRNGKYYLMMSGCTGWAPNAARSAVADSIWGPWRELGNPCRGKGADLTFRSQSTYILNPVGSDRYIYIGDRWKPENPVDGTYIWLPIEFEKNDSFIIRWKESWRL